MNNMERFSLTRGPSSDSRTDFEDDVRAGLTREVKELGCRHLYDERGSQLFDEICVQPEYYPTRVEAKILEQIAPKLARRFGKRPRLIELGAGSSTKTRFLIDALIREHSKLIFEPIDISPTAIEEGCAELLASFPDLEVRAIAAEYVTGLKLLAQAGDAREDPWLISWLGSSIGNFHRVDAASFLSELRKQLSPGDGLLVGIDMRKEKAVLEAAYDDAAGVTGLFMGNLLVRINAELGGEFDPEGFGYRAHYNEELGRVEMSLSSKHACKVAIRDLDLVVDFEVGEAIHMENSYKYSPLEIESLATMSGLRVAELWSDEQGRFSEVLFEL
ncbi:MAG: L-histidine N-alpha-methyltransferase [Planctomycetota bacterium]|jgi:L-histidine N-alpha-methyltransferase